MARGYGQAASERKSLADRIGGFAAPDEGADNKNAGLGNPTKGFTDGIGDAKRRYANWDDKAISTKGMIPLVGAEFRSTLESEGQLRSAPIQLRLSAMKATLQEMTKNVESVSGILGKPPAITIKGRSVPIGGKSYEFVYVTKPIKYQGKWTYDSFDEGLVMVKTPKQK